MTGRWGGGHGGDASWPPIHAVLLQDGLLSHATAFEVAPTACRSTTGRSHPVVGGRRGRNETHLGVALEHAPASHEEEGVPAEDGLLLVEHEGDVARRVPWRIQAPDRVAEHVERVSVRELHVNAGDSCTSQHVFQQHWHKQQRGGVPVRTSSWGLVSGEEARGDVSCLAQGPDSVRS